MGWREVNMVENSVGGGGHGWRATSSGGVHWEGPAWSGTTRAWLLSASHISMSVTTRFLSCPLVILLSVYILL